MIRLPLAKVLNPQFSHIEAEKMAAFGAIDLRPPRRVDEEIFSIVLHQIGDSPLAPRHKGKALFFGPGSSLILQFFFGL